MADLAALDVLIVDDHETMRALLRKMLERAGLAFVREAASGEEALAAMEQRPAQLLLIDQNLPAMSGAECIARVRADSRWAGARIVMITGHARGEVAGADAVLVKPVSPRAMLLTIDRLVR
jgi:two-component system chemotaxis response regulator CheY